MTVRRFFRRDRKFISRVTWLAKGQPTSIRKPAVTDSNTKENQGWFVLAMMCSLALSDELIPAFRCFLSRTERWPAYNRFARFFQIPSWPPIVTIRSSASPRTLHSQRGQLNGTIESSPTPGAFANAQLQAAIVDEQNIATKQGQRA